MFQIVLKEIEKKLLPEVLVILFIFVLILLSGCASKLTAEDYGLIDGMDRDCKQLAREFGYGTYLDLQTFQTRAVSSNTAYNKVYSTCMNAHGYQQVVREAK